MNAQIINIEMDPKDQDCVLITLRHLPGRFNFWRPRRPKTVVYKGYYNNWYQLPDFRPAPAKIVPLLKAISYGHQFKHLRVGLATR